MSSSENGYVQINKYIDTQPMVMNWEMDTFLTSVKALQIRTINSKESLVLAL